jgi:iron complex outermembrane recepter protein
LSEPSAITRIPQTLSAISENSKHDQSVFKGLDRLADAKERNTKSTVRAGPAVSRKKMIDQYACFAKSRLILRWSRRILSVLMLTSFCSAQDQTDLTQLSPEQLSKIEVTSMSKKEQKLSDTAGAVFVITRQDIRNSAATSIPELLRMVPGLQVAQLNGYQWAVSARGFAEQYASKMLVLVDGRSLFDPLFSGVVWSEQTMPLEDIERIEITRGPGGTVWGTNAVNGVINIITREAKDTSGSVVSAGVGNQERSQGFAQYGGKISENTHYRIYSRYYDQGPAGEIDGQPSHDSSRSTSGGFRVDTQVSKNDRLMVEGMAFSNNSGLDDIGFSYTPPFNTPALASLDLSGQNLLGSWTHKYSTGAQTNVQVSIAHVHEMEPGDLDQRGNVVTVAAQHEFFVGARHDIVSGVEYDSRSSQTGALFDTVWFVPANSKLSVAGAFLQDEILFLNGAVHLTLGLRAEHNSLSGMDYEPNARILWKATSRQSLWMAYGLANRGASPSDTFVRENVSAFPGPAGTQVVRYFGNPDIKPETLHAFELGYRLEPYKSLSFDLATFYNRYLDLIGSAPAQPFFESGPPSRLVIPIVAQNNIAGASFGAEFSVRWIPRSWLRLSTAYSLLELDLRGTGPSPGDTASVLEGQAPRHQLYFGASGDITKWLRLDSDLAFRDRLHYGNVPGYTTLDSKLSWHPRQHGEFSLGAKDLLNKEHIEFVSNQGGLPTMLGRSVYGKATWHF